MFLSFANKLTSFSSFLYIYLEQILSCLGMLYYFQLIAGLFPVRKGADFLKFYFHRTRHFKGFLPQNVSKGLILQFLFHRSLHG